MQPLEQGRASSSLALQTPVASDERDKARLVGHLDLDHVLEQTFVDEGGDDGRAREVALLVRAVGLARFGRLGHERLQPPRRLGQEELGHLALVRSLDGCVRGVARNRSDKVLHRQHLLLRDGRRTAECLSQ